MVTAREAEQLRLAQVGIRKLVERDLQAFFATLNLNRPETARDELLVFVPMLVAQYGEDAANVAADWYDTMRADARARGRFRADPLASPYMDGVEPLVRRAAGALFTTAPAAALVTLLASTGKFVLGASRETIGRATDRDPAAAGWQRVTQSGACDFCQMLANRGGVYKRSTVHFAAHGGECSCAAVPTWDQRAREVDASVYEASKRTSR